MLNMKGHASVYYLDFFPESILGNFWIGINSEAVDLGSLVSGLHNQVGISGIREDFYQETQFLLSSFPRGV